jgi:hypothetical protein
MKTKSFTILILSLIAIAVFAGCSTAEPEALQLAWPPAGEAIDANPILQWQSFEGADEYSVTVTAVGADTAVFTQKTAETNIPIAPALTPGSYTWHVEALGDNEKILAELDSTFSVKDVVTLVAPDAFETVGAEPELKWQAYPGAISYQVIVINDAFPPVVVCEHTTTETSYVVSPALEPASYSWRVWAFDSNNQLVAELNSNIVVEGVQ